MAHAGAEAEAEAEAGQHDFLLLVRNASQLVTVVDPSEPRAQARRTSASPAPHCIANGSLVVAHDGTVAAAGPAAEVEEAFRGRTFERVLDAAGASVVPGLCDGHTHPVWSGDRVHEFRAKLAGATYMEVHAAGGGIGYTVRHTRESDEDELAALFRARLDRMLRQGTTLVEAKSGYGLRAEDELKMLRVIQRVARDHPVEVVANFCGAHSVPEGMTADEATRDVVDVQLPAVAAARDRGEVSPELVDVFCERGVFDAAQAREILEAGRRHGLAANFHGDELSYTGSAELAAELGALAVSHLEHVSDEGVRAMAERGVVAVLLPTTAYVLRIEPPPARALLDGGCAVALGSDFNPNAHCLSMPAVMNLACVTMRMTMDEALVAATVNAAASMGRAASHGALAPGMRANFVVVGDTRWEHLVYEMSDPPIRAVYVGGRAAYEAPSFS